MVQSVGTDGQLFQFLVFQLNTTDLVSNDGIKNLVWIDSDQNLYESAQCVPEVKKRVVTVSEGGQSTPGLGAVLTVQRFHLCQRSGRWHGAVLWVLKQLRGLRLALAPFLQESLKQVLLPGSICTADVLHSIQAARQASYELLHKDIPICNIPSHSTLA